MLSRVAVILAGLLAISRLVQAEPLAPPQAKHLASPWGADGTSSLAYLKQLDLPSPPCEDKTSLEVAPEYFVEIANDLPGRTAYNDLVRLYRAKTWDQFDSQLKDFQLRFSDSPLREAAAFLWVEAKLTRIKKGDAQAKIDAEKTFRQVMLLYPQSTFVPVMLASTASHWLELGDYESSLALYREAAKNFPAHPLACVFLAGSGEASLKLRDIKGAQADFTQVLSKCENPRLRAGAQLRLGEIEWESDPQLADKMMSKAFDDNMSLVERFYPRVLFNLGEIKYRAGNDAQAKFFFDDYFRRVGKEGACMPFTLKRQADLALHSGEPVKKLIGLYLGVGEAAPLGDAGRISEVRAILLDYAQQSKAEQSRRRKLVDSKLEAIADDKYRYLGFLEKGLAMLSAGNLDALPYLNKLEPHAPYPTLSIHAGVIADFVRHRLFDAYRNQADKLKEETDDSTDSASSADTLLAALESAYPAWWKGNDLQKPALHLYGDVSLNRFERELGAGDTEKAMDRLEHWVDSALWPPEGPDKDARTRVGVALIKALVADPASGKPESTITFLKHEKTLRLFSDKEFSWVWLLLSEKAGDAAAVKLQLEQMHALRSPASLDSGIPKALQGKLWLDTAKALTKMREFSEAEILLSRVKDRNLVDDVEKAKLSIFMDTGKYSLAYGTALDRYKRAKADDRKNELGVLYGIALEGKLWPRASGLMKLADQAKLAPKELAPYHFLLGRSAYERNRCPVAIESYTEGLKLDPAAEGVPEAKFLLGKCFFRTKRKAQAMQIWNEVVQMKDPFWSPLAQNEIKLLPD